MNDGPVVFVNYRQDNIDRSTVQDFKDILQRHLPSANVFLDSKSIKPSTLWEEAIRDAIAKARALVVLVGPDWHRTTDEAGNKRIDQEGDWVRYEIATALKNDTPIFPVLLDGGRLPKPEWIPSDIRRLLNYQAVEISTSDLTQAVPRLAQAISDRLASPLPPPQKNLTILQRCIQLSVGSVYLSKSLITRPQWEAGRLDVGAPDAPFVGGVTVRDVEAWLDRFNDENFNAELPTVSHLRELEDAADARRPGWREWCRDQRGRRRHLVWAPGFRGFLHRAAAHELVGFRILLTPSR